MISPPNSSARATAKRVFPEAVGPLPPPAQRTFPPQAFLDYFDTVELAPEGFWGWPEAATAEKGRRAFEQLVRSSLEWVRQIEARDERPDQAGRP